MAQSNDGPYRFPATEWPLVDQAAHDTDPRRLELGKLLIRYLPPLRAHLVLNKRIPPDRADDLLQSFVADQILGRQLVAQASREKGKFRTLLLTALDRHVINQLRRETAQKRRQPDDLESQFGSREPRDGTVADPFEVAWAREVLAEAVKRMRAECASSSREDLWGVFECRILKPAFHDEPPVPYEQLVQRFGFVSPTQAANAVITARRMFIRILRAIVAEYVGDDAEVDAEIAALRAFLDAATP